MNFEYSKNPEILKRVKELKKTRYIFLAIIILSLINYLIFALNTNLSSLLIISIVYLILISLIASMHSYFIATIIKESLEEELNPELFLNLSIWLSKIKLTKKKNYYNALTNIASAYIQDGKYDEARDVLDYLEKQKIDKMSKSLYLLRRIELLFYKKRYKEIKDLKDDLLYEMDTLNRNLKASIIFRLEMYTAMIDKDKKKLKLICDNLESTDININKVYSLYIKSIFFEEADNKYQKMLAFEGGNLFIAREEYEDQNITTKNNLKPTKHKFIKICNYIILMSQIIFLVIAFITIIL